MLKDNRNVCVAVANFGTQYNVAVVYYTWWYNSVTQKVETVCVKSGIVWELYCFVKSLYIRYV